jgi:hypothetical protein
VSIYQETGAEDLAQRAQALLEELGTADAAQTEF